MKDWSIRTKGLFYIILVALVPLLISGLYIYESSKNDVIEMQTDKIELKQEAKDYMITKSIGSIIDEIEMLARGYTKISDSTIERDQFLQDELKLLDEAYIGLGFIEINEQIHQFYRSKAAKPPMAVKPSEVQEVIISGNLVDDAGKVIAHVSVPVKDEQEQFIGSLFASFYFPPNYYGVDNHSITMKSTHIYHLDGSLIFNPNLIPYTIEQQGQYDAVIKAYINEHGEKKINNSIFKYNMKKYVIVHRVVNEGQWMMIEVIPMSQIRAETFPSFVRIFTSIFVIITVASIVFYIYFNTITRRLYEIVKVTKQGANGMFNTQHLDASIKDEIGILSHSINGMMNRLEVMFSRLDAVINQNQSPVVVTDEQYRISYLNKEAERLLGVSSETVLGKFTPITFIDFEDVQRIAKNFSDEIGYSIPPGPEMFIELRRRHANYNMEFTIVSAQGRRIPVYDRSSAIRDKNGKMLGIISILQDLSDHRRVEQARNRLQDIVGSARDLIASVDQFGDIVYLNEAGKRMLGVQSDVESLRECLPENMYKEVVTYSEYAKNNGHYEVESEFKNLLGESFKVSISIVSHSDPYTGEYYYSCIVRDLTELLDMQEKLVEATAQAEQAAAAKGSFLALMSHEIRTPLNGIIGLSQLLQRTKLDYHQQDYTDKIKDSSDTLLHIVNDILDFSKLEVSKIELEQRLFNIYNIIDHISVQVSHYIGGKDYFDFKFDVDDEVPKLLVGDGLRLEQVLSNLSINAVKFTSQGLVSLKIAIVELSEQRVLLRFSVKDTGIGISEEQLNKLFTPFTQADSTTTRQYGGTGLGLVIAKQLVQLMGGTLEVDSKPNVGSEFSFISEFEVPEQLEKMLNFCNIENEYFAWVIEDSENMIEYWGELLAKQKIAAIGINTWKDGYSRLCRLGEGAAPNFIVLDMEMPDMYGIETWRSFKQEADKLNIPILALTTTHGREELSRLDIDMQPDFILAKPIQPLHFQKLIYEITHHREQLIQTTMQLQEQVVEVMEHEIKANILIAEDNKINQLVAKEMLKLANVRTTTVNNGKEAIERLSEETFDLILMDIHMPIMDGLEATKWIRAREEYAHIPVVAVTANIVSSDHAYYKSIGMQYVMSKPIEIGELLQVLGMYLKHLPTPDPDLLVKKSGINSNPILMQKEYSEYRELNVVSALERLNGKWYIYHHMLKQFATDYRDFISSLEQYIEVGNLQAVHRMLHTLKGASSYLGAHSLNKYAKIMEQYALEKDRNHLTQHLPELDDLIKRVLVEISTMLEKS